LDQAEGILVGRIQGAFGIQGWLKITSYCRPKEQILKYMSWHVYLNNDSKVYRLDKGRPHGRGIVAHLSGVDTRSAAEVLRHARIWVPEACLPELPAGEYYWYQLVGLDVVTVAGQELGKVMSLMETGAHDVLVVRDKSGNGEILIPYVRDKVVKGVDLDLQRMVVAWEVNFD